MGFGKFFKNGQPVYGETPIESLKVIPDALSYPELSYQGFAPQFNRQTLHKVGIKAVLDRNFDEHFTSDCWNGGIAISDDICILTFNKGYVAVLQWSTKELLATGQLASASNTNHANNCSFSNQYYNGNTIPLLYVSQCYEAFLVNAQRRCYVENITWSDGVVNSTLVQTIDISTSKSSSELNPVKTVDWVIDRLRNKLYGYGYTMSGAATKFQPKRLMEFDIPDTLNSTVTLTDADIKREWLVPMDGVLQGSGALDGLIAFGYTHDETPIKNGIVIYSVDACAPIADIVTAIDTEIEGVTIYEGRVLFNKYTGASTTNKSGIVINDMYID